MRSTTRSPARCPTSRRCGCAAANHGITRLPAAGMPWFMTVFGRDTLITSSRRSSSGPSWRGGALEVLAELQATRTTRRSTPSRARSSTRCATARRRKAWFARYYGTVDATPLYLVLLSEVWRWTDDARSSRELREPALRALAWIDEYGDRDGDGFVEYERRTRARAREPVVEGLGRLAALRTTAASRSAPIAPCEVQGYVYDAKLRTGRARARGLARPRRSPSGSSARPPSCSSGSTRRSGSRSAAATTRSRSTARSGRSTRSARTSGTCSGAGSSRTARVDAGRRRADGRCALVGLGRPDDVDRRRRLQPARVPQRHRLAARQLPDRLRASPATGVATRPADRPADARRGRVLRLPAARGVRRARRARDAVPDRVPDRGAAAGLGGRHAGAAPAGAARPRARPAAPDARDTVAARAADVGRRRCACRACAPSTAAGTCTSRTASRQVERVEAGTGCGSP